MSRIIKANNFTYTVNKSQNASVKNKENLQAVVVGSSEAEDIYNETKKMVEDLLENARKKAEQILNEGKIKAESLIEESEMEIEKRYEEARDEGYKEGKIKAEEETYEIKENANKIIKLAYSEKEKIIKKSEQDILNFIIDTIDRIYFNSLSHTQDIVFEVSKSLVAFIKDTKGIIILKVSEQDYPFLENKEEELNLLLSSGTLSIKIDNELRKGHCVLFSDQGILEVDLEENLERVKAVLQDVVKSD